MTKKDPCKPFACRIQACLKAQINNYYTQVLFIIIICLMPVIDPCKAYACLIQACLKEHNYQEPACQNAIEAMRDCCRKWKDKSYVCGGIDTGKPEK